MTEPPPTTAPASRPPAVPLIPPQPWGGPDQPALPEEPTRGPDHGASALIDPADEQRISALVLALLEVLSGRRPPAQLASRIHPGLLRSVRALTRSYAGENLRLGSLRVQSPRAGVIEASVRVVSTTRHHPVAVRLIAVSGVWGFSALETPPIRPRVRDSS